MSGEDTPPRPLTVDEAVTLAILLQKNNHLDQAQALYREVLAASPDHPRALHFSGVLAHQQGRRDDAVALVERSLVLRPEEADWHSNLGIIAQAEGNLERAIDAYRRAIALDPAHANAQSNLGVVLRATGSTAGAEAAYRRAIEIDPEHIDAYTNLGVLLNATARTEEAAACYCRVVALRPKHRPARKLLALAHCTLGEVGEAVQILEEWLADEPDDPIARHLLAACTQRDVPARASASFVQHTFDDFADNFEAKLERLGYRAPRLIAVMLEDAGLDAAGRLDVLDAGCGTGLCGRFLAPYARRLHGVDLSRRMLAHAMEKHVYDELTHAELTEYLRSRPSSYDVIVSADSLVYFGDLQDVTSAAAASLRPGGALVFTLEHMTDDEAPAGYRLEYHGRYSHARAYVQRVLERANFRSTVHDAELRMEAGKPVSGLVVRATRDPIDTFIPQSP